MLNFGATTTTNTAADRSRYVSPKRIRLGEPNEIPTTTTTRNPVTIPVTYNVLLHNLPDSSSTAATDPILHATTTTSTSSRKKVAWIEEEQQHQQHHHFDPLTRQLANVFLRFCKSVDCGVSPGLATQDLESAPKIVDTQSLLTALQRCKLLKHQFVNVLASLGFFENPMNVTSKDWSSGGGGIVGDLWTAVRSPVYDNVSWNEFIEVLKPMCVLTPGGQVVKRIQQQQQPQPHHVSLSPQRHSISSTTNTQVVFSNAPPIPELRPTTTTTTTTTTATSSSNRVLSPPRGPPLHHHHGLHRQGSASPTPLSPPQPTAANIRMQQALLTLQLPPSPTNYDKEQMYKYQLEKATRESLAGSITTAAAKRAGIGGGGGGEPGDSQHHKAFLASAREQLQTHQIKQQERLNALLSGNTSGSATSRPVTPTATATRPQPRQSSLPRGGSHGRKVVMSPERTARTVPEPPPPPPLPHPVVVVPPPVSSHHHHHQHSKSFPELLDDVLQRSSSEAQRMTEVMRKLLPQTSNGTPSNIKFWQTIWCAASRRDGMSYIPASSVRDELEIRGIDEEDARRVSDVALALYSFVDPSTTTNAHNNYSHQHHPHVSPPRTYSTNVVTPFPTPLVKVQEVPLAADIPIAIAEKPTTSSSSSSLVGHPMISDDPLAVQFEALLTIHQFDFSTYRSASDEQRHVLHDALKQDIALHLRVQDTSINLHSIGRHKELPTTVVVKFSITDANYSGQKHLLREKVEQEVLNGSGWHLMSSWVAYRALVASAARTAVLGGNNDNHHQQPIQPIPGSGGGVTTSNIHKLRSNAKLL